MIIKTWPERWSLHSLLVLMEEYDGITANWLLSNLFEEGMA